MAIGPMKFNPGFLSDQELVDSFCVRMTEFEMLVETLRESTGNSNPHVIVVGPRGIGKTMLLLRVVVEVRRDRKLRSAWFPVVFPEESYEINTAGEFWLQCLSHLADQAPQDPDGPDLALTLGELRREQDDQRLKSRCLGAVLDFAHREGKRLLLVVENLNTMFDDIGDSDVGWELRHTLQNEQRIFLLGSATSRFAEIQRPDRAMFDLFQVNELTRLNTASCAVLWKSVSGHEISIRLVRALEILTGGNPRLLTIVAQFGAKISFHELMDGLLRLVDNHTEYFRSHLEALGIQDRRVYLALARLWRPATAREVSNIARLPTNNCSAVLRRLVDRGAVLVVGGSPRRKEYYLAERMYNIYYLLRIGRGTDRLVEALLRFMTAFYSRSELIALRERISEEAPSASGTKRKMLESALQFLSKSNHQEGEYLEPMTAWQLVSSVSTARLTVTDSLTTPADSRQDNSPISPQFVNLFRVTERMLQSEQYDQVLAIIEDILSLVGEGSESNEEGYAGVALVYKVVALAHLDRPKDAIRVSDLILRRFTGRLSPEFQIPIAIALAYKATLLGKIGRLDEMVSTCQSFTDLCDSSDIVAPDWLLATILLKKGTGLAALGRSWKAVAVFDEVIERFKGNESNDFDDIVVRAQMHKGGLLVKQGHAGAACSEYDDVVKCYWASEERVVCEAVDSAVLAKVTVLGEQGRWSDALDYLDSVVGRFNSRDGRQFTRRFGAVQCGRGMLLDLLHRSQDAYEAYDSVIRSFELENSLQNAEVTALAFAWKSSSLLRSNRTDDGFASVDAFVKAFSEISSPFILQLVATTLLQKAHCELELDRFEAAIVTVGSVLTDFSPTSNRDLIRGRILRAEGFFRLGNERNCQRELTDMLRRIPECRMLPPESLEALVTFTVRFGPQPIIELIEGSRARDLLVPFVVALRKELGIETKVAKEVDEVANDIRLELAQMRESKNLQAPIPSPERRQSSA